VALFVRTCGTFLRGAPSQIDLCHDPPMRHAKILCTIGPASSDPETLGKLIDAGMNAARLNLSHGDHSIHAETYRRIRKLAEQRKTAVTILADLQGPKIRVGSIPEPGMELVEGETLVFTVDPTATISHGRTTVDCPGLAKEAKVGQPILMDDGAMEVVIEKIEGDEVYTRIITGGILQARKGVNLPETELTLPSLTEKDEVDLRFAMELGVDMVALSFVRRVEDILHAQRIMDEFGRRVPLVAKIEKPEAVENLESIADSCEGMMVARGDLGVEMGPEEVPMAQKRIIEMCNSRGKLVITATQMLDSMIRNPRPTRAEASDVANAVLDGSDAVMLSGETATGKFPVSAVKTMARIIVRTEEAERFWVDPPNDMDLGHTANAMAAAAVASSRSLSDTCAIITYTGSGGIARLVSDYRPKVPIYAFTPVAATFHALALYWGVIPIAFEPVTPNGDHIFEDLDRAILERGLLKEGDRVVIALGWPLRAHRSVNLLKVHRVGQALQGTS